MTESEGSCPTCRKPVDPSDPSTVWAVERVRMGRRIRDGDGAHFHLRCWPIPNYRLLTEIEIERERRNFGL